MSKLQNIILNHLPKEFEMENQTNIEKHYRLGFNHCLQEIIKALPRIEEEILGFLEREVLDLRYEHANIARHGNTPDDAYDRVDNLLSSLTKDNVSKQSNHN